MFGKRGPEGPARVTKPDFVAPATTPAPTISEPRPSAIDTLEPGQSPATRQAQAAAQSPQKKRARTEDYYNTKSQVFSALIDTIDLSQLAKLDAESAREEIRDIVNDIITIKSFAMSIAEQEELLEDICNDVLGYGPLEPLLARDDIADIMVNGSGQTFIEVGGKTIESDIRFRDNSQLLSIC
ncbi:MAG TPA: protein kinase, partial [Agrobacterium sp.]|nr:protein kinase [Agrobacterium sp.]